jgi:hypothetical protein
MGVETLLSLVAGIVSALVGGVAASDAVRNIILEILGRKPTPKPYSERLSNLTGSLTKASSEVDAVLKEMAYVARERESSVRALEAGLVNLEKREKDLKEKIAILQNVPIPVAEQFAKLVEPVEKRNAHRDYVLFVSGVVVTTVIAIVLRKAFGI